MKVWELEEGKEYTSNALCDLETTKYKIINGELHYSHPTINYGEYIKSGMEYNRAIYLDFTEYIPPIDWSKVEVDTKILCSESGIIWAKRHFAKYNNETKKVYAWDDGATSFTTSYASIWTYAKLYTEIGES